MNLSVMRAYYRSTNVEREMEGFRGRMFAEWKKIFPDTAMDEQRVCSQLRSITTRRVLSAAELDEIKREILQELQLHQQQGPPTDSGGEEEENLEEVQPEPELEEGVTEGQQNQEEVLLGKIRDSYESLKLQYQGVPLESRPRIPKLKCNAQVFASVAVVDQVLGPDVAGSGLEEVAGLVHCAALAVCQTLGVEIKTSQQQQQRASKRKPQDYTPPWRKRIEERINRARRDIGHLAAFFADPQGCSKKVMAGIRTIARTMRVRKTDKDYEKKLREKEEQLRQRIAALGARIRRYNEAAKRRQQESLFAADQKLFFRKLEAEGAEEQPQAPPTADVMAEFWSAIWSEPKQHSEDVYWLREEEEECEDIPEMPAVSVTLADVQSAVKKTQNWKAPGVDGIHNFWWKYFKSTHQTLATNFDAALRDPSILPRFCTLGITYMKPKSGDSLNPKNYRPITCLPTLYKIFTSILSMKIYDHLVTNGLLAEEQNGCRKGTKGCRELLVVDTVVSQQARKKRRNISVGWVDYKKAFDSVPHSWLLSVLHLYKIHPCIVQLLTSCMDTWRTCLHVNQGGINYKTREMRISRGIFQGDSLSPLWFCLALNPLSRMLRTSGFGYVLQRDPEIRISHQFYMDDLKLYASSRDHLHSMFELVKSFSDAICMEFGLDKCAVVHVKKGEVQNQQEGLRLMGGTVIQDLGVEDNYKYLGLQQLLGIKDVDVRKQVEKKVLSRVNKICKSFVSARNKISAINSWAIPVAAYTFGVVGWSETSLRAFDRKLRTTLTKHRMHHPRSSVERLYLSRHVGGRGLLSMEVMCRQQELKLRQYFVSCGVGLHAAVCNQDRNYTPLKLCEQEYQPVVKTQADRVVEWLAKALHGRYAAALSSDQVDTKSSTEWLRTSGLFAETEGFVFAIQDQVIRTRAYERHILKANVSDRCRLCKQANESIQHVAGGCPVLAPKEYLERHNSVAKVVHQALAKRFGLAEIEVPYYKCKPEQVLRNQDAKLLWDSAITTDRAVEANRPDLVLFNKKARTAVIVDIAVPLDENLVATVAEKKRKYQPLAVELKDMYQLLNVDIIPVVISSNGLVTKDWSAAREKLALKEHHLRVMQKAAILGTANIVRKVLSL